MLIKDTTTQTFVKDVIEESKRQPVLVDFWAPWCGPCKQLTPILEKVVKAAKGKVKLVKMNIDEHPAIPGPDGHPVDPGGDRLRQRPAGRRLHGRAAGEPGHAFIERLTKGKVGGEDQDLLKAADAALADGDAGRRSRASTRSCWPRTAATCTRSPGSRAAMSRPARSSRPSRRSPWCRRPSATRRAVAAARAALELAEQAKSLGPFAELEAEGRRQSARSSGALRSRARAQCQGQARGGGRPADRDRQARPQMERRRRAQAARAVLRGLGPDRPGDGRGRKRLSSVLFA